MAVFKFVISNPKTRKSYNVELDQEKGMGLTGKKIKDNFNGDILGLSGYEIQITGGTDKDGFPMHPQVHGAVRKKIILSHPPGFHPKKKGQRKRKMVRGNTINQDIVQINCKIIKEGSKPIEELLGKKEVKEEKPPEKVEKIPKEKKIEEAPKEKKAEKPAKETEKKKLPEKPEETTKEKLKKGKVEKSKDKKK